MCEINCGKNKPPMVVMTLRQLKFEDSMRRERV